MSNFAGDFCSYLPTGGMNNEVAVFKTLLRAPKKMMLHSTGCCSIVPLLCCFSNLPPISQLIVFLTHGFLSQTYCSVHKVLFPVSQVCHFLTYTSRFSLLNSPYHFRLLLLLPCQASSSRHSHSQSRSLVSLSLLA